MLSSHSPLTSVLKPEMSRGITGVVFSSSEKTNELCMASAMPNLPGYHGK